MSLPRVTDRSRVISYQRCPRARWFEYYATGSGVRRKGASVPLVTGGVVHEGLACLLGGRMVEEAVSETLKAYDEMVSERGFEPVSESDDVAYTQREQRALAEALVRVWAKVGLPKLLEEFQVLSVEEEIEFSLPVSLIKFMSRPDAVLRERASGDLYVLSFKTAAKVDKRRFAEAQHDDQGISEMIAVESQMGQKAMGVRYEFLVKGDRSREKDAEGEETGRWVTHSRLLRAYVKRGVTSAEDEFRVRYKWHCEGPHVAHGKVKTWNCPGDKWHKLGMEWVKTDVWDLPGGVKGWVDWLAENASSELEAVVAVPPPVYRHQAEVESWLRQVAAREHSVWIKADTLDKIDVEKPLFAESLDHFFPQHRRSCDWPGACQFQPICFGPVSAGNPLLDSGFEKRIPNHPAEEDAWKSQVLS